MTINYCSIGQVTIDLIDGHHHDGGSCLYGSLLASKLGKKSQIVTSIGKNFKHDVYDQIEWKIQPSPVTTTYELVNTEKGRQLRLLNKAEAIHANFIDESVKNANMIMFCPIADEISPEIINQLNTEWIGLTPQGWFRTFHADGWVKFSISKYKALPRKIKLIVVSEEDLIEDQKAWHWIKQFADVAVCTMGKRGYRLAHDGQEGIFTPLEVLQEKNSTGCGDIFSASMLMLLERGLNPIKAAECAGQAAALASTQDGLIKSVRIAADYLHSKF